MSNNCKRPKFLLPLCVVASIVRESLLLCKIIRQTQVDMKLERFEVCSEFARKIIEYSETGANDHLRIATTCLQRPPFWRPIVNFYNMKLPLNKDLLSRTATKVVVDHVKFGFYVPNLLRLFFPYHTEPSINDVTHLSIFLSFPSFVRVL